MGLIDKFVFAFYRVLNPFYFRLKGVVIHGRIRAIGFPIIRNNGNIELGRGVDMRSISRYTAMGVSQRCFLHTLVPEGCIRVGEHTGMSGVTICSKELVEIGCRVQIGSGVAIFDTDFHSIDHEVRGTAKDLELACSRPVLIGNDVFIGARSIVCKGVTIGARSIVGAGAVVVKDIPSDSVAAGNPARVIKTLV